VLTFSECREGLSGSYKLHIDPDFVVCVKETERKPGEAFWQKVAIITTRDGERHIVYDHERTVAQEIENAQSK
jgi:hypothetical protein